MFKNPNLADIFTNMAKKSVKKNMHMWSFEGWECECFFCIVFHHLEDFFFGLAPHKLAGHPHREL